MLFSVAYLVVRRNSSAGGSRRRSADHLRQISRTAPGPVRGSVPGQMYLVVEACGFVTYVTRQRANPRRRLGRSYFSVGHRQAVTG